METTNVTSTKSAPMTTKATRLDIGPKQTAGQCDSNHESYNPVWHGSSFSPSGHPLDLN
jgi:hypothetical protein